MRDAKKMPACELLGTSTGKFHPQGFTRPFFRLGLLKVSLDGLSERGTTRDLLLLGIYDYFTRIYCKSVALLS